MPTRRPNILILMCDQLNANVLSCYGGQVPTPHVDRLAAEGVRFTDATCPLPVCSPSRASLILGVYPHTHGVIGNVNRRDYPAIHVTEKVPQVGIKADDVTTEGLLHACGYDTHHYGKWHLMEDDLPYYPDMFCEHDRYAQGMAETFAVVGRRPRDEWMDWYDWALPVTTSPALRQAVKALAGRWDKDRYAEFIVKMGRLDLPLAQVFDVQVADQTVAALRRGNPPFMITCSFNYPHDPNVVPSPYYEMFDPEAIRLPANWGSREARFEQEWSRRIVAELGEAAAREFLRIYFASVKLVDDQVGRVLKALDDTGHAKDTVVVFTADHSDMAGGHGMVWKSTSCLYDEVARVPLIIRYPAEVRPCASRIAAGLTDLMPTLLEFASEPAPSHVQGHSLAPYLRGERDPAEAPPYSFCERISRSKDGSRTVPNMPGSFMVRGRGWKLIRYANGEEYLYNLTDDPGEMRNLAAVAEHEHTKRELRQAMDGWLARTRHPLACR